MLAYHLHTQPAGNAKKPRRSGTPRLSVSGSPGKSVSIDQGPGEDHSPDVPAVVEGVLGAALEVPIPHDEDFVDPIVPDWDGGQGHSAAVAAGVGVRHVSIIPWASDQSQGDTPKRPSQI